MQIDEEKQRSVCAVKYKKINSVLIREKNIYFYLTLAEFMVIVMTLIQYNR